jgi:hypothetical protein
MEVTGSSMTAIAVIDLAARTIISRNTPFQVIATTIRQDTTVRPSAFDL